MNVYATPPTSPTRLKVCSESELSSLTFLFSRGTSKTAAVLDAIASNPGITTDSIREYARCSNVPDLVFNINKKLMNKMLMIVRVEPLGCPPNAAFHHWYLIEAPIMDCPVGLSVNDPNY